MNRLLSTLIYFMVYNRSHGFSECFVYKVLSYAII